ncbi:MAG: gliding motility protein GldL [Bacteroidales bacterium]|nr:gliding motility protein GldL [Bacteroidales bacterium]
MSKLYGWGAAVVILGALFKINHYQYANEMLIVGLGTEALIFFFSGFEPPHVEPDWSLVYPQLGHMYHLEKGSEVVHPAAAQKGGSIVRELDKILEEAKIDPVLLQSLGDGMRKLSENTSRLSNLSSAAVASDDFIISMKAAANSVEKLSESSKKSSELHDRDAQATDEYINNVRKASQKVADLSNIYIEASTSMKSDLNATADFANAMKSATQSANNLTDKYTKSAELIAKSAESLDLSKVDSEAYSLQLKKVSSNLSSLNTTYEMQLQSLNQQIDSSTKIHSSVNQLLNNLSQTSDNMTKYREEMDTLTRRIAALNSVYGNMLSAMNLNIK